MNIRSVHTQEVTWLRKTEKGCISGPRMGEQKCPKRPTLTILLRTMFCGGFGTIWAPDSICAKWAHLLKDHHCMPGDHFYVFVDAKKSDILSTTHMW